MQNLVQFTVKQGHTKRTEPRACPARRHARVRRPRVAAVLKSALEVCARLRLASAPHTLRDAASTGELSATWHVRPRPQRRLCARVTSMPRAVVPHVNASGGLATKHPRSPVHSPAISSPVVAAHVQERRLPPPLPSPPRRAPPPLASTAGLAAQHLH
jgi:hypothetical protein